MLAACLVTRRPAQAALWRSTRLNGLRAAGCGLVGALEPRGLECRTVKNTALFGNAGHRGGLLVPVTGQPRWMSTSSRDDDDKNGDGKTGKKKKKLLERVGYGGGAALLLLNKSKAVIGALKFAKVMPAFSILANVGVYGLFYGWPFGVGVVSQIFVHECGHWAVMKYYGIPTGAMVFIPFMGAYVEMKDRPRDVHQEAMVAFGGPVVGGAAAFALSGAGIALDSNLLVSLAEFGFFINLMNLFPVGQLDGGRITGAISPYFLVAGLLGGGGLIFSGVLPPNPMLVLILMMGGFSTYSRFFPGEGDGPHRSYYRIPPAQKASIAGFYFALIAALVGGMVLNAKHKKTIAQLRAENPNVDIGPMGDRLSGLAEEWDDPVDDSVDDAEQVRRMEEEFHARYFGAPAQNDEFQKPADERL